MYNEGTPEIFVDQGLYYPAATNYAYYCTGFESPGEWEDHRIFSVDGSEFQYAGAETESLPYVYYTPGYGYAESPYNPYNPYIPGANYGVDGPYVASEQYYAFSPFQDPMPSPGYIPISVQSDFLPNSSAEPMLDTAATLHSRPGRSFKPGHDSSSEVFSRNTPKPSVKQTNSFSRISEGVRAHVEFGKQSLSHGSVSSGNNITEASSHLLQGRSASASNGKVLPHRNQLNVALPSNNGFFDFESGATERTSVARELQSKVNVGRNINGMNGNLDLLGEQNRGPRTNKARNQLAVKAYTTKVGGGDAQGNIIIYTDQYNRDDFSVDYVNAKFFVIKSYSEDDVHKSIKYNVWSSTHHGNKKLQSAYEDAQMISSGKACACPIFLFFSVNASGQFCGVAEMIGPVEFHKDMDFWQQDKWSGSFHVKWHIVKDVPNSRLRHIMLPNNENKPVTSSRDTQEIMYKQGLEMLKIFRDHPLNTSVLDDFIFYESREKIMQEEKARLAFKNFQTPVLVPVAPFNPIQKQDSSVRLPPNKDEKVTEEKHPYSLKKPQTSAPVKLSLNSGASNLTISSENVEHSRVKAEDDIASALKISSLDINPKADAVASLVSTVPVGIMTVGSMPVKVNGFAESSGFLTVGSIPLNPRALQLDQGGAPAKSGSSN